LDPLQGSFFSDLVNETFVHLVKPRLMIKGDKEGFGSSLICGGHDYPDYGRNYSSDLLVKLSTETERFKERKHRCKQPGFLSFFIFCLKGFLSPGFFFKKNFT
jgi:hypothetical protein